MKVLLCCIGKNENRYVREFVEYYKKIGITKIRLYDNNDPDGEHFEEVIGDYIDDGFVEVIDYRGRKVCQLQAYSDCYSLKKYEYEWITFVDMDEYITLEKHKTIQEYLSQEKFSNYEIIKLCWLCYGDSGLIEYDNRPLQERFTQPAPLDAKLYYNFPQNCSAKAIVRGGLNEIVWHDPHVPHAQVRYCNAEGGDDGLGFNTKMLYNEAYIKHYTTKTAVEFLQKIKHGAPDRIHSLGFKKQLKNLFFTYNEWTQEKEDILNMGIEEKLTTLVCCIGKNENRYVREYVEWYKKIGVTHIRIYDNNDLDGEHFEEVIGDYIDEGFVEIINYRGREVCQLQAYDECYKQLGVQYDWILFIDCGDEYLDFNGYNNIVEYLSDPIFKNYDMIHVNLMTFGDGGNTRYDNRPLMERIKEPIPFDRHVAYNFPENNHVSSILRGGLTGVDWVHGLTHTPHAPHLKCCNEKGVPTMPLSPFEDYSFEKAFFRHYTTKTAEEYCDKMKRGFPDQKWDGSRIKNLVETRFFRTNEVTQEKVDIFKKELGIDMSYLLKKTFDGEKDKKTQIFTLCFEKKQFDFLNDAVITPLQVGSDVTLWDVCDLKDNTGDNISKKNFFYIENTGTYWIWKNIKDAKYKGQMQYRRPLNGISGTIDFDKVFSQYDVITCIPFNHPANSKPTNDNPMFIPAQTVEDGYAFSNCRDDIAILEMIINIYYPEYKESYKKYIKNGPDLYYSNGFIMKSEDFDRYCEFLFGCLEKYEQFVDVSSFEKLYSRVKNNMSLGKYPKHANPQTQTYEAIRWQTSIGGFLSERIWTLWLLHNFKDERIMKLPYNKMEEGMYT